MSIAFLAFTTFCVDDMEHFSCLTYTTNKQSINLMTYESNSLYKYTCNCLYFYSAGTRYHNEYPCPIGTYNNRTGLQSDNQCTPCTAGYYCPSEGLDRGDLTECDAGKI